MDVILSFMINNKGMTLGFATVAYVSYAKSQKYDLRIYLINIIHFRACNVYSSPACFKIEPRFFISQMIKSSSSDLSRQMYPVTYPFSQIQCQQEHGMFENCAHIFHGMNPEIKQPFFIP